jgi:hypothetical protein
MKKKFRAVTDKNSASGYTSAYHVYTPQKFPSFIHLALIETPKNDRLGLVD